MPSRKARPASRALLDMWSWQQDAACRELPVEMFVGPEGETPTQRRRREAAAVEICASCPVRVDCLNHALEQPEWYGVWGGTTESERAAERRRRRAA